MANRIAEIAGAFDVADGTSEKIRQPDCVHGLLRHQRIGPDAGRLGHRILHQPVQPDHLRALQLGPPRQRLRRILAMMQEEFQVEAAHVAAGIARACRVQPHRGKRIGKAAIDALDGVERKLPLRHV
jgi:hypothetical protein